MLSKELETIKEGIEAIKIEPKRMEVDLHFLFYVAILFGAIFKFYPEAENYQPVDVAPLYKDLIKIDPLEILKDETPSNLVDF